MSDERAPMSRAALASQAPRGLDVREQCCDVVGLSSRVELAAETKQIRGDAIEGSPGTSAKAPPAQLAFRETPKTELSSEMHTRGVGLQCRRLARRHIAWRLNRRLQQKAASVRRWRRCLCRIQNSESRVHTRRAWVRFSSEIGRIQNSEFREQACSH